MNDLWQAEIQLTGLQAAYLIREQFPALNPVSLKSLGTGWDNAAYLVNEEFVFRFPRRKIAVDCLQNEIHTLPHLANRLSVCVPNPIFLGEPSDSFPWLFAGYRTIPGETACKIDLNDEEQFALVEPIAKFLKELHTIPEKEFSKWGVPNDSLGRYNIAKRLDKAEDRLRNLVEKKLLGDERPYRNIIRDTERFFQDFIGGQGNCFSDSKSLVHGDFYLRHLLLDRGCLLSGVIDWGDIHAGYPACDLMFVYSFFSCEKRDRFWNRYGDVTEDAKMFARFHALLHTLNVFDYANSIADTSLIRESQKSLDRLAL